MSLHCDNLRIATVTRLWQLCHNVVVVVVVVAVVVVVVVVAASKSQTPYMA